MLMRTEFLGGMRHRYVLNEQVAFLQVAYRVSMDSDSEWLD